MTSFQSESGNLGNFANCLLPNEDVSANMDSIGLESLETELRLPNESIRTTPRSGYSGGASASEVFTSSSPKLPQGSRRPQSARTAPLKSHLLKVPPPASSIPLPVKSSGPIKVPSLLKNARSSSRTSSVSISRTNTVANKHTLEIQFLNKNKRYLQMKKELLEKQKPVLELYHNLVQIKKRLEEMGKSVKLEDIKVVPVEDSKKMAGPQGEEPVSPEVVSGMKNSIEEIPKTLMDVCKNLLSRRALIVDLLESVTKSEVDISDVSGRIESLKSEGQQLQHSLDAILAEHQAKITELVANWQKLLNEKQSGQSEAKVGELQNKLRQQETLAQESNHVIHDLQRKLEDSKVTYSRSVAELNGIIQTLREQIKKLENDLESERKATGDIKSRHNTNSQNVKTMRAKINELEADKKTNEQSITEMQRKIKFLQDQVKHKEAQWGKEKDELNKHIKQQDSILQKLTSDKTQFQSTLEAIENLKNNTEEELQQRINVLERELEATKNDLTEVTEDKNEALEKCAEFEGYIARMGLECKETMNKVSCSIKWGKQNSNMPEAENYMQDIAKDLRIRELEDTIKKLEREKLMQVEQAKQNEENLTMEQNRTETDRQLTKQQECITKYQILLQESENKLKEKSMEVANLRSEIRQLKVRQEALEEQNYNCPTEELQKMVEEGRFKLNELMKKSIESEQKLEHYANVIERQTQQMSEMENLLRYRENMAGVLKASRDELVLEKESLTRYSQEMRTVLAEVNKEGKMKDRLIKELQEKIDLRERQISKLEKEVRELEANLVVTNDKRYKLQETIGALEKELQSTKAHVNQLADINSRNVRPKLRPF